MHRLFSLAAVLVFLAASPAARALTMVSRDFDQLVQRADTVFKGTVTTTESRWVGDGAARHIATFVTFQVAETYKGTSATEQTLEFLGGTVGAAKLSVPDMPTFTAGQSAILFVVHNGTQYCPIVGISQGRFHVRKDFESGTERVFTDNFSPLRNTGEIGRLDAAGALPRRQGEDTEAMAAADFKAEIVAKVHGLAAAPQSSVK